MMNKVRVVQRILCDQLQQIEVGSAAFAIGIRLPLNDIEEEAQVAVIATELIDDLNHIGPPFNGDDNQRRISRCWKPSSIRSLPRCSSLTWIKSMLVAAGRCTSPAF